MFPVNNTSGECTYSVRMILCIAISNFFDKTVQLHKKHNKFLWRGINFETFILRRAIACLVLCTRTLNYTLYIYIIYIAFKRNNIKGERAHSPFFRSEILKKRNDIVLLGARFIKKEIRLLPLLYTPTNTNTHTLYRYIMYKNTVAEFF